MVVTVVLLVIMGGVLQLLSQAQQRYVSTANVADSTATARDATDLMARDIRLAGYPPPSSYPVGVIVPGTNEQYTAIRGGFLALSQYAIQFEADIDAPARCGFTIPVADYQCTSGSGVVSVVDYQLQVPTGGDTGGCAGLIVNASLTTPTLMRSQVPKNATGMAVTPVFVPFVTDVVNCRAGIPIFVRCQAPPPGPPPAAPWPGAPCPNMSQMRRTTLPAPQDTRVVLIRLQVQTRNRDPQTDNFQVVEFYNVAQRLNPDF